MPGWEARKPFDAFTSSPARPARVRGDRPGQQALRCRRFAATARTNLPGGLIGVVSRSTYYNLPYGKLS